jgi:transcription antitermination factor NusG
MVVTKVSYTAATHPAAAPEQGRPVAEGWHVVQVFTGREQKICDDLRDAGWQVYCPMEVKWRRPSSHETPAWLSRLTERRTAALNEAEAIRHAETRERALAVALRRFPRVSSMAGRNHAIEVRRAFIPGYVFVASDASRSIDAIRMTRHTPGIDGVAQILMRSDGTYARVRHEAIQRLMEAETQGLLEASRKGRRDITEMFTKGQPVRVVGGPMDGFTAKVVACSRKGRLKLLLDAFGIEATVDVDAVEAVGAPA